MSDKSENPGECAACGFETDELTWYDFYPPYVGDRQGHWVCRICASTLSGNYDQYPTRYENGDVFKTIAYCTNLILAAIEAKHG